MEYRKKHQTLKQFLRWKLITCSRRKKLHNYESLDLLLSRIIDKVGIFFAQAIFSKSCWWIYWKTLVNIRKLFIIKKAIKFNYIFQKNSHSKPKIYVSSSPNLEYLMQNEVMNNIIFQIWNMVMLSEKILKFLL